MRSKFDTVHSPSIPMPFTNSIDSTDRLAYFGELSPGNCPAKYLSAVQGLITSIDSSIPVIVNYMGWIEGLGLHLLSDISKSLKPTKMIQLLRKENEHDIKIDMNLLQNHGYKLKKELLNEVRFQYVNIDCSSDDNQSRGLKSIDHRQMMIGDYFLKIKPLSILFLHIFRKITYR